MSNLLNICWIHARAYAWIKEGITVWTTFTASPTSCIPQLLTQVNLNFLILLSDNVSPESLTTVQDTCERNSLQDTILLALFFGAVTITFFQ